MTALDEFQLLQVQARSRPTGSLRKTDPVAAEVDDRQASGRTDRSQEEEEEEGRGRRARGRGAVELAETRGGVEPEVGGPRASEAEPSPSPHRELEPADRELPPIARGARRRARGRVPPSSGEVAPPEVDGPRRLARTSPKSPPIEEPVGPRRYRRLRRSGRAAPRPSRDSRPSTRTEAEAEDRTGSSNRPPRPAKSLSETPWPNSWLKPGPSAGRRARSSASSTSARSSRRRKKSAPSRAACARKDDVAPDVTPHPRSRPQARADARSDHASRGQLTACPAAREANRDASCAVTGAGARGRGASRGRGGRGSRRRSAARPSRRRGQDRVPDHRSRSWPRRSRSRPTRSSPRPSTSLGLPVNINSNAGRGDRLAPRARVRGHARGRPRGQRPRRP